MHWDGFAPTSVFTKGNFWSCTEREYVLTPAQSILQPGVERPAGMWKAQPLDLEMEPGELAAPAFPSPGACKVFILLLSLSHSFILNETRVGSQRGGEGKAALPSQGAIMRWEYLASPSSAPKKTKGRGESGCLKPAHRSGGGWWSMPGIPPPRCQTGPGDRGQREVAKCCETQKEKKKKLY